MTQTLSKTGRTTILVLALLCSGCGRGEIMEAVALGGLLGEAAATITILAIHEATEHQHQVAREQGLIASQQLAAQQKTTPTKKKPRYIAVPTAREPTSKGAKSVMIFDTQTAQVVGNHVYDIKTEPKTGQVGKFETYSAEYVGTGRY